MISSGTNIQLDLTPMHRDSLCRQRPKPYPFAGSPWDLHELSWMALGLVPIGQVSALSTPAGPGWPGQGQTGPLHHQSDLQAVKLCPAPHIRSPIITCTGLSSLSCSKASGDSRLLWPFVPRLSPPGCEKAGPYFQSEYVQLQLPASDFCSACLCSTQEPL